MPSTMIRASRRKTAAYLALCTAFAAVALVLLWEGERDWRAWLTLVLFALGACIFVWSLIRPHQLLLDEAGFELSGGFIRTPRRVPWGHVERFFVYRLPRGGKMIGYNLVPEVRARSALAPLNRSFGADAALPKTWPGSPERIVEQLNDYRIRALAPRG